MPEKENLDPAEVAFFSDLQTIISRRPQRLPQQISRICGVDAAYDGDRVFAAACLFESGQPSAEALCVGRCTGPYGSGLFYLREGPFAVEAVRRLKVRPQLVCFDAHGAAHPHSAGLATICGMVLGIPSVGIGKSTLAGTAVVAGQGLDKLAIGQRSVGFVTRQGAKRYWSPGYSVSLPELERIIEKEAPVCLQAIAKADRSAKEARPSSVAESGKN